MASMVMQRLREVAADFDAGEQWRPERLDVEVAGELSGVAADETPLCGQDPCTTGGHISGDSAGG